MANFQAESVDAPGEKGDTPEGLVRTLENRSYTTYKDRLFAYNRLEWWDLASNILLVALSTSTTIASVGLLVNDKMYGTNGDALMVALAILSLVASLLVANAKYGARAKQMELSYKQIQCISMKFERLRCSSTSRQELERALDSIQAEYFNALESSENHLSADHKRMVNKNEHPRAAAYTLFLFPAVLLIPFVIWLFDLHL